MKIGSKSMTNSDFLGEADGASIGETVGADDGEAVLKHPNSQNEQRSTAAHGVS